MASRRNNNNQDGVERPSPIRRPGGAREGSGRNLQDGGGLSDQPENRENGRPWEEHGPRIMTSVSLNDIDDKNTSFQFRFPTSLQRLRNSLAARGQLNPIKIMPGNDAYVIIDGFSRYAEAKKLGWEEIKALIYPNLSDKDAKKISWECNIVRTNLSFAEKANAMLLARKDGLTLEEVASLFRLSVRQASRYLAMPGQLRDLVDGEVVTMAHAAVFKRYSEKLTRGEVEELVEWIRSTGASAKKLKARLKSDYSLGETRGRQRKFGRIENGRLRVYAFELGDYSSAEEWSAAHAFLLEIVRHIDERARSDGTWSEKKIDRRSGEQGCST